MTEAPDLELSPEEMQGAKDMLLKLTEALRRVVEESAGRQIDVIAASLALARLTGKSLERVNEENRGLAVMKAVSLMLEGSGATQVSPEDLEPHKLDS